LLRTISDIHGKTSDRKGPVIRGITFTQYAYRAIEIEGTEPVGLSAESQHGKEVIGTTLENCTISYCSRVAGYFRGDSLTIRSCKVSDTRTEGIYIIGSSDVLLEKNIFMRNNIENITGYYPAAVKIFNQCYRTTCRDNYVTDQPNSNGIWYDVGNVDGVFINNWIENVGGTEKEMPINQLWPSQNGFFFEISKGVICTGNVFRNCDHGMMILNSCNAQVYQNTFINSPACIGRNERTAAGDHFGWHPSTGPDIDKRDGHVFVNNLMYGAPGFNRPLLFVWQPPVVCSTLPNSQLKELDYNVFVRDTDNVTAALMLWSPAANNRCQAAFQSPEAFHQQHPEFLTHSPSFINYNGPLFKGLELGNYQLLSAFPAAKISTKLPAAIMNLPGIEKQDEGHIGAYAPVQ
jgi:hypothetical protein